MTATAASADDGTSSSSLSFIDIGANILDDRYQGNYRGTQRHVADLNLVLERAIAAGLKRLIVTAGTLEESRHAIQFCRDWNTQPSNRQLHLSCTVGIHPTRCQQEFVDALAVSSAEADGKQEEQKQPKSYVSADEILEELLKLALDGKQDGTVVAVGEVGLDYDRLEFCPKDVQLEFFQRQLQILARETKLPLFLHNRSVGSDLYDVLVQNQDCWKHDDDTTANNRDDDKLYGVVHSFDDSIDLAQKFLDLGFTIGLNGCSLRTEANLETVAKLPLNRLLLETDCPYCDVRSTHAGFAHVKTKYEAKAEKKYEMGKLVKNRQEPCHIVQIAEIVAGVQQHSLEHVAQSVYETTNRVFFG